MSAASFCSSLRVSRRTSAEPGVIEHLRDALSLVRESDRRAEVALALGHALYWAGEEGEGVEVLERALAEA